MKKASEAVQCIRGIVDQRLIINYHELPCERNEKKSEAVQCIEAHRA